MSILKLNSMLKHTCICSWQLIYSIYMFNKICHQRREPLSVSNFILYINKCLNYVILYEVKNNPQTLYITIYFNDFQNILIVSFWQVSFRFDFVSFCLFRYISFRFGIFRFVSFTFVSYRFYFVSHRYPVNHLLNLILLHFEFALFYFD